MNEHLARLKEIAERKNTLREELNSCENEERVKEIVEEAEKLATEEQTVRTKMLLDDDLGEPVESRAAVDSREKRFTENGMMEIPLFNKEGRALLVSSGKLAAPTAVSTEVGMLNNAISSILDDVEVIDATGTGSWKFPYVKTNAEAADVTEGNAIGGTETAVDFVEIGQKEWGVYSEVSGQIKKTTPVNYMNTVERESVFALRAKAKDVITKKIIASELTKKVPNVKIDADYLRTVVLGFGGKESVGGGTKLYINRADLITLGKVRTTGEKIAHYKITFADENNGMIEEGGLSVAFSINDSIPTGQQLYGQPKSVKLLLWDNYEVKTDEGGENFKKNIIGVRGLQTADADLVVNEGFHRIGQSTLE